MRYTTFGRRTGLRVSRYALGTGNFGTRWGSGADRDEARAIFDRFVDAGGNFLDTADAYQVGESEELLGTFIKADRDDLVVATKCALGARPDFPLSLTGNGRKSVRFAVEQSLRRLDTDHVDLLWVHYPDGLTPMDELLRGLSGLVDAGKVLHIAFSNFPAWRVARGSLLADVAGWAPVAGIQIEYSLVERGAEGEQLPMAEALGLGVAMWSPLGGGLLTGKYRESSRGRLTDLGTLVHTESSGRTTAVLDAVLRIARDLGCTPGQVAMAWIDDRARRLATTAFPIIGPRTTAQLDDYLGAADVELTSDHVEELDRVSAPDVGIPHAANEAVLDLLRGGRSERVDRPLVPVI